MTRQPISHPCSSRLALLSIGVGAAFVFTQAQAAPAEAPAAPAAPATPATPAAPAAPAKPKPKPLAAVPSLPPGPFVPTQIVLQNGYPIPLSALVLKADKFELKTEFGKYPVGATILVTSVDHVFGDKPPAINQAIALLLMGKSTEARKLLTPVLAEHKDSAKFPGNYWLEAARVTLVANAIEGATPQCDILGKDISAALGISRPDAFMGLSKALLLRNTVKLADRQAALKAQTTDAQPADVCAYASFFLAGLLQSEKRNDEAMEAYLAVPCLFPSGGMVINGMAQFKAAEALTDEGRKSEAVAMVQSAIRYTKDTPARDLATKLYDSIK